MEELEIIKRTDCVLTHRFIRQYRPFIRYISNINYRLIHKYIGQSQRLDGVDDIKGVIESYV
jgi:hypothetical protein